MFTAGLQPRYVELKGDASSMHPRNVWRISQGLRGQAPITFASDPCCRVRHAEPESPIHVLSECGDASCGAHRLNYPEVRQRFRTFITRTIRKSTKDPAFIWVWQILGHQTTPQNPGFQHFSSISSIYPSNFWAQGESWAELLEG